MHVTVRTIVEGLQVWVNGEQLSVKDSRLIHNHSSAFAWGFPGSGPSQTSLAICLHLFGPYVAQQVYQHFKFDHVQHWHRWDDGERSVDIGKFYENYVEGKVMEQALSRFSHNIFDRLFAALGENDEALELLNESAVVNSDSTQTRIITDAYSSDIEAAAEMMGLSYFNVDGQWNIIGTMPTTEFLRKLLATSKISLEV